MEETIGQSGAFLQTVIDAISDVLLVIDTDYRIVLANRAAREMAGSIDSAVCLTCHQLSHHRDLPCEGKNEPCPLRQCSVRQNAEWGNNAPAVKPERVKGVREKTKQHKQSWTPDELLKISPAD